MKKIAMLITLGCALTFNANAQGVEKGTSLVDVYYGFPNLYGAVFKAFVVQSGASNISTSGIGPIGIKYEYLLANKFGLGVDFNYSNYTVKYANANNTDAMGNPVTYHYSFSTPAIRAMIACNFHFVTSERIDVYAAVKTGYYNRTFSYTSDDPGYNFSFKSFIPIAFRLETGMRFFFTKNVGIHVNAGIGGGPIVAGGLALKF